VDRVHGAVDRGQGLGGGSPEDGRNGAPVRKTSPRLRKKGEGTTMSFTGCKTGRRRDRNGRASVGNNRRRRHSVWAALGRGEKRREERRGEVR
jgi:hypothetical protein